MDPQESKQALIMRKMTKAAATNMYCRWSPEETVSPDLPTNTSSSTRLAGRWLIAARVLLVAIAFVTLSLFVIAIPTRYNELQHVCTPGQCNQLQLSAADMPALEQLGFSLHAYANFHISLEIGFALGALLIAAVIFWLRSDDWMALFASLALIIFGATLPPVIEAMGRAQPEWRLPALLIQELAPFCMGTLLYLFPDGRFVPRWTALLVLAWGIWSLVRPAFIQTTPFALGQSENIALVGFFVLGAGAQLYRHAFVSTPAQRQQTRWVVFGLTTLVLGGFVYVLIHLIFLPLTQPGPAHVLANLVSVPLCLTFPGLLVPLTIGIAILRYRLWDIDLIIKRTLHYTSLTAVLALIYFGLVIALQFGTSRFIGQAPNSDVAIVVSTLAIVALFQPLRHNIQQGIDRRFFRSKYDAVKTLEAFSATFSSETDLNELSEQLVVVIQETMQPTGVALWLFQPAEDKAAEASITRILPAIGECDNVGTCLTGSPAPVTSM
jgi:hypothetical protein